MQKIEEMENRNDPPDKENEKMIKAPITKKI